MTLADPFAKPHVDETTSPWVTRSSTVRYENPWISVRHDEVVDPSGRNGVYGVVSPRNYALGVLPIFDDGSVALVGQYRYALGQYSWEMPEGGGVKGEPMLDSIVRELREETGCAAEHWLPIVENVTLSNSVTDERVWCWAAWGLSEGESSLDSTEHDLVTWRVPFQQVVTMIWDGTIHDSMTIMTATKVEAMRLRNELPTALQELLS